MREMREPALNLDQRRARYAWACVVEAPAGKDYGNLAKAAPALIMANGLMATLAFYEEKGQTHHGALARHLRHWLAKEFLGCEDGYEAVMQALFEADPPATYRRATEEALAVLRWIRQFAAARSVTERGE